MNKFKIVGGIILAYVFAWVVLYAVAGDFSMAAPRILGVDSAALAELPIAKEELDTSMDHMRALAFTANRQGRLFSLAEKICYWVALITSAIITLIGGLKGQVKDLAADPPEVDVSGLPHRYVRMISILAAIGAVCVALSAPLQTQKQNAYDRADTIIELAYETRKNVLEAATASEAQQLLDEMVLQASR
ncbi:MAG: hypothetical protein CME59_16360 [Halioglobus sp.]|nr:hypothetical protein [Halioglobus sp.]